MQLEARHSSPQRVQGLVMLYYPAHLVSLAALHSPGETAGPSRPPHGPGRPSRRDGCLSAPADDLVRLAAW